KARPIETMAPSVLPNKPVHEPTQTRLKTIDTLVPTGRGPREFVIGDLNPGPPSLALATILNQKGQYLICIYVAPGQKDS
ncbi:F0F1 ATP synthase subunit alpha, partial [Enterococcus faecium]